MPALSNTYAALPEHFYARVQPATVPAPRLLAWNDELAAELGLQDLAGDAAEIFSGNTLPEGAEPIAQAYAGHQFAQFVPQLGDGRAVLLGEALDRNGRRFDIQLKGAGRTPFSRGGDGKSWVGPVVREYLVSEAMHHLGVPTTRALAAVQTGETVYRDEPRPGGVFTRVASSHIRVGTFQFFAARDDADAVRALADYAIARHYPAAAAQEFPYLAFFGCVIEAQAALVAKWLSIGFIHGVMNTDNTAISGETIDYGPCAFMDEFQAGKVFSSIDRRGRYAYGNQPNIAAWNLARLAECLLLIDDRQDQYEAALAGFGDRFQGRYLSLMRAKLGLQTEEPGDAELIQQFLDHLEVHELDFTLGFRDLAAGKEPERFGEFEAEWQKRIGREPAGAAAARASMDTVNPLFIPRNHQVENAIAGVVANDSTVFDELREVLRKPCTDQPCFRQYSKPPTPAQRVTQTFCGT